MNKFYELLTELSIIRPTCLRGAPADDGDLAARCHVGGAQVRHLDLSWRGARERGYEEKQMASWLRLPSLMYAASYL